jgi:hypothetical protein
MAVGKEIGVYDLKSTSVTLVPGKRDTTTVHINYEGELTGEHACTVFATMTLESPDGKDGTYTICARWFLDTGEILDAVGEGQTTLLGDGHKWLVAGVGKVSNGQNAAVEGEIDLATRSFTGKMFERV